MAYLREPQWAEENNQETEFIWIFILFFKINCSDNILRIMNH